MPRQQSPEKQVSSTSSLLSNSLYTKHGYISITSSETSIAKPSKSTPSTHAPTSSGKSSICGVFWNMINALVGAGILAIPYVYAQCGIFGGILLIILFVLLCTYTLNLMIDTAKVYQVTEYEDLGHKAIGKFGYVLTSMCLFLEDYGTMLNYLIILGDSAFSVIQIWGYDKNYHRQLIIIFVSVVIIFPPCLWRDISLYQTLSAFKFIAIAIVICVVLYQYLLYRVFMVHAEDGYVHQFTPQSDAIVWFNVSGIPSALGIIAYCFACHDVAFRYYNTLTNPTTKRWITLVLMSMTAAMTISLLLSIPAYFTFGNNVEGNVLNNYSVYDTSIIIVRIIYVLCMALTYPTGFFVVRHIVYANWNRMLSICTIMKYKNHRKRMMNAHPINNVSVTSSNLSDSEDISTYSSYIFKTEYNIHNAPLCQHLTFTFVIFFSNLGLALVIDNLGTAMSIIGSLSSVNLAFVLPSVAHICTSEYKFNSCIYLNSSKEKFTAFMSLYPPLFIAMFGSFIAVYGVVSTLQG